jgi:hypothetical protein
MRDPLSHKINQWEASPPPGAWENISRELSEWNAEKKLAHKLNNWEAAPPVSSWTAITEQVSGTPQPAFKRGDVPVRTLSPYLVRYGAAAAIIGVIAWFLWSSPFKGGGEMATSTIPLTTEQAAATPSGAVPPALSTTPSVEEYTDATYPDKQTAFNRNQGGKNRDPRDPAYSLVKRNRISMETTGRNWQKELVSQFLNPALKQLPVQETDRRYIRIASNTGNPVRLSAKYAPIYHQLTYPGDNVYNRSSINSIEQKILTSQYTPDPGNLFDILQLVEILEEK